MWPKLTNIESNIKTKIDEYSNNVNASNLNTWIRVISGAEYEPYKGLILQSNINNKLLSAMGQADSIYGNSQSSGILGRDWEGKNVQTTDTRFLRPSPIVTSFGVKEGKDQISREATLQVTAYSLEQMEALHEFLMQPGYSLYIEWGWNVPDSYTQLTPVELQNLAKTASDRNLNWQELSKIRKNSNGTYDSFLGFIIGGSVSNSGENFSITVTLRGTPSLPTYLQSHKNLSKIENGTVINKDKSIDGYREEQLLQEDNPLIRKFGQMFNELPAFRKTETVKKLLEDKKVSEKQFINFDKKISKEIASKYDLGFWAMLSFGDNSIVDVRGIGEIKKELLYSQNRYIRMDLATDIINAIGSEDYFDIGGKKVKFNIDISNCFIGGFPFMFSTNPNKLIIPTKVPDFFQYFLQTESVTQSSNGFLTVSNVGKEPIIPDSELDNFLVNTNLDAFGLKEKANYYGYLKYLFVNFEVFLSKIQQSNKNIREIYIDILNEISSAANSFWNFQIVEGEVETTSNSDSKIGDIVITVIDENWGSQLPFSFKDVKEFKHNGDGSSFLDSSLEISIPAELTGLIVNSRLASVSGPEEPITSVNTYSYFNSKKDLFLTDRESSTQTNNENSNVVEKSEYEKLSEKANSLISYSKTRNDGDAYKSIPPGSIAYYSSDNKLIKVVDGNGKTTWNGYFNSTSVDIQRLRELEQENIDARNAEKQSKVTSFLNQLDIVPKVNIKEIDDDLRNAVEQNNIDIIRENFSIYCFKDTEYFDKLRNEQFVLKYKDNNNSNENANPSLSHPLPIKYSFTILGNSGIRRGDVFKIKGIPKKYSKSGVFQVTEIEHSIEGMVWKTTITGDYRQIQ
jgi:hypothetical protein